MPQFGPEEPREVKHPVTLEHALGVGGFHEVARGHKGIEELLGEYTGADGGEVEGLNDPGGDEALTHQGHECGADGLPFQVVANEGLDDVLAVRI